MKNEQQQPKSGAQNQDGKNKGNNQPDKMKEQKDSMPDAPSTGKMDNHYPSSSQKSNISVNNDGKIGKAHDQWQNENKGSQQGEARGNNRNEPNNQPGNNKTVTEPEIDAPIYDPEKTEKKIPAMESNKNSK